MAYLHVFKRYEINTAFGSYSEGSLDVPQRISIDGLRFRKDFSLATATTLDIWTAGAATLADFDFLWCESDQNLLIELTVDRGAEVGTVVYAGEIRANLPFDLPWDDAMANYTANFATGTEDVVDRIRLRNVSGSTATGFLELWT